MGLFRRRAETQQELETLREELRTMRARLDQADAAKISLADRIGQVGDETQRLIFQVDTIESHVGTVQNQVVTVASSIDHAVARAASAEAVDTLRTDVTRLHDIAGKIDDLGAAVQRQVAAPTVDTAVLADLGARLEGLTESLARQREQIADVALVATDAAARTDKTEVATTELTERADATDNATNDLVTRTGDSIVALGGRIDAISDHDVADEVRGQLSQLAEKVTALDSRVHQISVELTNQITELSSDVEGVSANAPADTEAIIAELDDLMTTRIDTRLGDVTGGQERLANEQARHAIQFRQELADLADRLRRANSR